MYTAYIREIQEIINLEQPPMPHMFPKHYIPHILPSHPKRALFPSKAQMSSLTTVSPTIHAYHCLSIAHTNIIYSTNIHFAITITYTHDVYTC